MQDLDLSWSAQNLSQALVPAGVTVKKGQELVNICCPIVISDAGLFNTYKYLLPENARCLPGKDWAALLFRAPISTPLGLACPARLVLLLLLTVL